MRKSSSDDRQENLVRALTEAKDYLEYSAEKSGFQNDENFMAVRNYLVLVLKRIRG